MRLVLILSSFAFAFSVSAPSVANAQGCTGPDCAQQGQGGGHRCEHEKKDEVTS